ncbi:DUF4906 domain-containing protein [Parabacteroides sp. TM07-1AC]|uniref:DUF4906 domain-containing protein n=1 Tax=Parabacteroides sp. TM07-1AC TaxID=2292363 RepID=UPI001313E68D|nr:DUF4906 domain-containing protein [Parabacteroides sp. TM07-1AC]
MNIKYKLSVFAASLLLMACTSENELVNPTPDETGQDDAAKREVLLTFKNKLNVASGKTKAEGDPIATAEENYIRSLDIYVFGSKDEINGYTFQELYYYRDDASTVAGDGDWAHSFNLLASAEDNVTTALLKLQKGLFIKLYCVVNRTVLYQTTPEGTVEAYTAFTPLRQDAPGQPVNNVVEGVPTEKDFLKLHTALIDPVAAVPTEDDILQTPLPMTGSHTTPIDLTDFSVSARTQLSFKLTRMAARFDIVNNAATSKFTVESISMGNGQRGTSFFPVKTLGKSETDRITYPARAITADNQVEGNATTTGAFYSWPSPQNDQGYLILKGKYTVNKTETQDVSYKVPFQQMANGVGSYIEVANNHRYTIAITKADTYHLDFTLNVSEWSDEGDIDEYDPNKGNDFDKVAVELITDGGASTGAYVMANGSIAVLPQDGSKFAFTLGSNTELEEELAYKEGSAQWIVADTRTKAGSIETTYTYKVDKEALSGKLLPVTIRLKNPASGKRKDIVVAPTAGPEVTLGDNASGSFSTFKDGMLTIYNVANQTAKLHVVAENRAGSTGSTLAIQDSPAWLTADATNLDTAEGDYTLTLGNAQDVNTTATVTVTSTASTAATTVSVKLKDPAITAPIASQFGNGDNTNNTFTPAAGGNASILLGEATAASTCTLAVNSPEGITPSVNTGSDWLTVTSKDVVNSNGSHTTTLTLTIVGEANLSEAKSGSILLTNAITGGGDLTIDVSTTIVPVVP